MSRRWLFFGWHGVEDGARQRLPYRLDRAARYASLRVPAYRERPDQSIVNIGISAT